MPMTSVLELHGRISRSKSMDESSIQHQRLGCSAALVNAIILVLDLTYDRSGVANVWQPPSSRR